MFLPLCSLTCVSALFLFCFHTLTKGSSKEEALLVSEHLVMVGNKYLCCAYSAILEGGVVA